MTTQSRRPDPFSGDPSLSFSCDPSLSFSGNPSLPFRGNPSLPFSGDPSIPFSGDPSLPFSRDRSLSISGSGLESETDDVVCCSSSSEWRQFGHDEWDKSQVSIHLTWKPWLHLGKTRTFSPSSNSPKHIGHSVAGISSPEP